MADYGPWAFTTWIKLDEIGQVGWQAQLEGVYYPLVEATYNSASEGGYVDITHARIVTPEKFVIFCTPGNLTKTWVRATGMNYIDANNRIEELTYLAAKEHFDRDDDPKGDV